MQPAATFATDRPTLMSRLADLVLRRKRLVIIAWVVVALIGLATAGKSTHALSQSFSLPGKAGYIANQQIKQVYGNGGNVTPIVPLVALPDGTTVDSAGVRQQLAGLEATLAAKLPEARIVGFGSTGDRAFASKDGRTTFVLVYPPSSKSGFDPIDGFTNRVAAAIATTRIAGAGVQLTGLDVLRNSKGGGNGPSVLVEAILGGAGALLVLVFVFASFLALLPLLMAVVTIPTTFLIVWPIASLWTVSFIVQFLVALIGLGVAIDYALLIVIRWKEERAAGYDNETAVRRAMKTAGTAVVFSGTTVAIGLLALISIPVPFLRSVGYAGMLIPLVSVAVAVTLLPALLSTVGPKLDWPRLRREDRASRSWTRWAELVIRWKWLAALIALAALGGLLTQTVAINLGEPKAESLAKGGTARKALAALERSGIGAGVLSPYEVVVPRGRADATAAALAKVAGVQATVAPDTAAWRRSGTALIAVLPAGQNDNATVSRVRTAAKALPDVKVGGQSVQARDFVSAVYGSFPLMIAIITLITFVLLARAFRSLLLPLKAVVLNVVSVAAAWGVLVILWQEGHGSKLIYGLEPTGSISQWVPLMVFAFLFGLSMDYEVFILARMREEYDATGSTRLAVSRGIGRTGRLVTSAALVLFLAFISLGSGPETDVKILASGLAAGIVLDATVVRALLVPALVTMFGRWNWWLPERAARLLRVAPSPVAPQGSDT